MKSDGPVVNEDLLMPWWLIPGKKKLLAVFRVGVPALALMARAQTAGPRPAPMFSRAYVDALQNVLQLEPTDVAALDSRLAENPDDFAARLKLIAYALRTDRAALPESRTKRAELVLWLIDHHPDSEILGSPYAIFPAGELTINELQHARSSWEIARNASPANAHVMWNAANFYRQVGMFAPGAGPRAPGNSSR